MIGKILAVLGVSTLVFTALPATALGQPANLRIDVAKNAGCGCCNGWVTRMADNGFDLQPQNLNSEDLYDLKLSRGMDESLWACHTASIAQYTIEGHVPAADILRLIAQAPDAIGLAVPGMPIGSPGMDPVGAPFMGFGDETNPFDVLLVFKDGSTEIFSSYGPS